MYVTRVLNRSSPPAVLLRESFRKDGKVKTRTLANLTDWPEAKVEALRRVLRGETLVVAGDRLAIERSLPHGPVVAVLGLLRRIGLDRLLPRRPERLATLALALIAARVVEPAAKLATARQLSEATASHSLGAVLGLGEVDEDELYRALDLLGAAPPAIEKALARRHLKDGTLVLYHVTSSSLEGRCCELARFGYSRVEPGGLQLLFDPGTGDHAAVADQHHPLQFEAPLQLGNLRRQRLRIAGVAFEHLDRHRAAVGGAQQPKDDLRPVGTAVAAVAEAGELATPAFEGARGDIVEHQRAVLQMSPRQRLLDRRLRRAQQIEGTVQLVLVHLAQPQHRAQRVRSRRLAQLAGGGQLRRRLDHAGRDQRQRQRGQPLRPPRQQPVETDPPPRAEHRDDRTVRQRPLDRQAVAGDHKRLAAQHPPQRLDLRLRPIRQIGECPGLHFAVLAETLAQEYGGRRRPVQHARDVHEPYRS